LRFIRKQCRDRVHFRPFDGWEIQTAGSVVAEVHPPLWKKRFPDPDAHGHLFATALRPLRLRASVVNPPGHPAPTWRIHCVDSSTCPSNRMNG